MGPRSPAYHLPNPTCPHSQLLRPVSPPLSPSLLSVQDAPLILSYLLPSSYSSLSCDVPPWAPRLSTAPWPPAMATVAPALSVIVIFGSPVSRHGWETHGDQGRTASLATEGPTELAQHLTQTQPELQPPPLPLLPQVLCFSVNKNILGELSSRDLSGREWGRVGRGLSRGRTGPGRPGHAANVLRADDSGDSSPARPSQLGGHALAP